MMGFFRSKRKLVLIIGVLCILALGIALRTGGFSTERSAAPGASVYNAEALYKYKTPYVGDNSKVVNLLDNLPYAGLRKEVTLHTKAVPYGITVIYDFSKADVDLTQVEAAFRNNAAIMFTLIENVDTIGFNVNGADEQLKYLYTRSRIQKDFDVDLQEYAKDIKTFETFLRDLVFKLHVLPGKYALTMSSTPGMRIDAEYLGIAKRVRYSAESGALFTWDVTTGKVSEGASIIEIPYGMSAYWSPLVLQSGKITEKKNNVITVALLDEKGKAIAERQVTILYDGSMFYSVVPSQGVIIGAVKQLQTQKLTNIDDAVSRAIKSRCIGYAPGEIATEGHVILDVEEKDGYVKAYTVSSYGTYGFENGIFTFVSGSGAIPTIMTFSKNEKGEYALLEYKEPMDGAGYTKSIKEMFPQKLWDKVLGTGKYPEISEQQKKQASEYLQSVGRKATVSAAHVEKKLVDINVEASNKLFAGFTKYSSELNTFPYWLGTKEQIEDGIRYIYETSQSKTEDGYDLIIFRKTTESGSVVKEYRYKIVGNEPQLLE